MIKRVGPFPVDFDFAELWESRIILERAKVVDFRIGARSLVAELVAEKIKDLKTLVVIGFIKLFQALILRGETAAGSRIDDKQDFVAVIVERNHGPKTIIRLKRLHGMTRYISSTSTSQRRLSIRLKTY